MLAGLTGFHLILIVGVLVLLFGAAKLPMLAKNLGSSAKILRSEMRSMRDDDDPARGSDRGHDDERGDDPVAPASTSPASTDQTRGR